MRVDFTFWLDKMEAELSSFSLFYSKEFGSWNKAATDMK